MGVTANPEYASRNPSPRRRSATPSSTCSVRSPSPGTARVRTSLGKVRRVSVRVVSYRLCLRLASRRSTVPQFEESGWGDRRASRWREVGGVVLSIIWLQWIYEGSIAGWREHGAKKRRKECEHTHCAALHPQASGTATRTEATQCIAHCSFLVRVTLYLILVDLVHAPLAVECAVDGA